MAIEPPLVVIKAAAKSLEVLRTAANHTLVLRHLNQAGDQLVH